MKIHIGCDHAGYHLKESIKKSFPLYEWIDHGSHSESSVDYPDIANKVCREISQVEKQNSTVSITANLSSPLGILICGSGQGMAIRANKFPLVRAALCWNKDVAILARQHNNANVLCLGARILSLEESKEIISEFTSTNFLAERHSLRVQKLSDPTD